VRDELLRRVPDYPEWVETRAALLDEGPLFGSVDGAVVLTPERDMLCVIGRPAREAFEEAVRSCAPGADALAQEADHEHIASLLEAPGEPAVIHAPGRGGLQLGGISPDLRIETLGPEDTDRLAGLPPALREELVAALGWSVLWACVADRQPVSFCYPGSCTEGWWDVSVDTLEPYRRRGCAAAAFAAVAEHMQRQGRLPAWGALESNEASWRLARKLGFDPVARVFVWSL
jgi:GNAT superfamily N-acetyltransferase